MTEETNEDFLITRLTEMDTNLNGMELSNDDGSKTAFPMKCWGRGCIRPDIKDLNLVKFFKLHSNENIIVNNMDQSYRISNSKHVRNDMMENIRRQCEMVLGRPSHQENIANWLKRNLETDIYKNENHSLSNIQNENTNLNCTNEQNSEDRIKVSKTSENTLSLEMPSGMSNKTRKCFEIKCKNKKKISSMHNDLAECSGNNFENLLNPKTMNKHDTELRKESEQKNYIIIKNIPPEINEDEMNYLLSGFGTVEYIHIEKKEGKIYANIRMANRDDCERIIECLDDTHPFGTASLPIRVFFQ